MMKTITEVCNAFMDKDKWLKIDDIEKNKHGFNILRFVSIKYPYHVNLMNHKDINIARATDFWHIFMTSKYNGVPKWFWVTAGANKVKVPKKKKDKLTDKFEKRQLNDYCNYEGVHYGLLLEMYNFNPDDVVKDIKAYISATNAA